MDLLADYDAADGDDGNSSSPVAGGASFGPGSFRARMTAEPTLLKTTSLALVPSSAHVLGSSSTAMLAYRPDQNLPVDVMYAPSAGPARPDAAKRFIPSSKGTIAGSFESDGIDRTSFEAQFHSYGVRGYAADPSGSGAIIADAGRAAAVAALSSALTSGPSAAGKSSGSAAGVEELAVLHAGSGGGRGRSHAGAGGGGVEIVGAVKRSRLAAGDAGNVDSWKGPWAGFAGEASMKATPLELGTLSEEQKRLRKEQGYNPDRPGRIKDGETGGGPLPPAIGLAGAAAAAPAEEEVAEAGGERKKKRRRKEEGDEGAAAAGAGGSTEESSGAAPAGAGSGSASARADSHGEHGAAAAAPGTAGEGMKPSECRSTWHGKESERVDYQGRSWLEPPKGVRADGGDHECYVPKGIVHRYTGHTKGVQSIQFFPGTGHLLLSGSMDSKIKIWDVLEHRHVRRTYRGHTAAVRQVAFGTTGSEFLSCSYDRHVKAWDAESGACIGDYTNDKVPYCVTWHPEDPNIFIVGSANRKMVQYDRRTGSIALEYNYHLGAVNTVTFVDAGRRIVSTSDDKKVLVWEYNAPVPIKYIADPSMQAIPSVTPHPSGEFIACQSMDNSIQVYYAGERGVSLNRKKRFAGHVTAGYACQIGISPDGHHIASGDGDGQVWFWDWRSGRFNKKVRAHEDGPAIGCVWHPLRPTMMATCGWDGIIKLWE